MTWAEFKVAVDGALAAGGQTEDVEVGGIVFEGDHDFMLSVGPMGLVIVPSEDEDIEVH